jgi:hypothetical protein
MKMRTKGLEDQSIEKILLVKAGKVRKELTEKANQQLVISGNKRQ